MIKIYPIEKKLLFSELPMEQVQHIEFDFAGGLFFIEFTSQNQDTVRIKTIPFGHAAHYPITFEAFNLHSPSLQSVPEWYRNIVNTIWDHNKAMDLKIYKETLKPVKNEVLVLNCLDSCFGHVIWKLFNVQRHLQNDAHLDLIVILPEQMKWLVPDGVAELWLVKCKLYELKYRIKHFDKWMKNELNRFTSVYLSKTYIHLDHHSIDLQVFHKTVGFNVDEFSIYPRTVTFVLRENRFWMSGWWLDLLFKSSIKFNRLSWLKPLFVWYQNNAVGKTVKKLKDTFPEIECNVIGIGKTNRLSPLINDLRFDRVSEEIEKKWCSIAAKSHFIVGVHGSHMILPTSLSAGFINLMPDYKIDNMIEDIANQVRGREALYLSRFLPVSSSSNLVAKHLISMFKGFPTLAMNSRAGKTESDEGREKIDKLK